MNNTNPGNLFGGTWVAWGTGRVPVGINTSDSNFNTVEKTGGASTHTLTQAQLPSVEGKWGMSINDYHADYTSGIISGITYSTSYEAATGLGKIVAKSTKNLWGYKVAFGQNQAHNNLQPYITCYMWKRTA